MNKIKYFVLSLVALALMPACKQEGTSAVDSTLDSLRAQIEDSLATASAEKDSLLALMDEINDGMAQLKRLEDIVTVENLGSETPDRKQQLRDDMASVQRAVAERRKKLDDLEQRLKQSASYNEKMQRTIDGLKKQLATQQAIIDELTEQLAAAHVQIADLNTRVDSLSTVNTAVREEKQAVQEENARLTDDVNNLNACYYAIGSKKELKAHKIIESGFLKKTKIMEGDFEKSYFTKSDKRSLTEIDLHSSKAEVKTRHPKDSYTIVEAEHGKRLIITDPARFWEQGNYLVVQIN